ncbi:Shedu immune nuclease family protein [Rhodococcus qingshengii]|uniref:Shedu immune nuclease family protein n=2 Tax=Actinomycetota TaxID=201174 RepID=UPI00287FDAFA|nr:Shedu immune nuclease family protein [Rhodococcus qingshengii]
MKPLIGRLEERPNPDDPATIDGFFVPLRTAKSDARESRSAINGVKILSFSSDYSEIRMFPIHTSSSMNRNFLSPKYSEIRTLTFRWEEEDFPGFEEFLENLPSGFAKDPDYGLGLLKQCNRIVRLIEEHTSCQEIAFVEGSEVADDGRVLSFGLSRFADIWKELNRIDGRGSRATSRVKNAYVHNDLASALNLDETGYSLGRHPISRFVAKAAADEEELTETEQDSLIDVVVSESMALAEERPAGFQKLHREVELVNLDRLIKTYEESLGKKTSEAHWQDFFDVNAFALQQIFGAPMVIAQSGATVGGGRFDGSGDKIADYLVKNTLTNNVALVEIKKPTTPLLGKEYRSGIYGASTELDGAITQVLDQAYQLMTNFATMKNNTRSYDLEAYAISCFVIAGRSPAVQDPDRQKSFELYRANSRNVKVVTYDEVLAQLKILRTFLRPQTTMKDSETSRKVE